jgi:hypothetical protein
MATAPKMNSLSELISTLPPQCREEAPRCRVIARALNVPVEEPCGPLLRAASRWEFISFAVLALEAPAWVGLLFAQWTSISLALMMAASAGFFGAQLRAHQLRTQGERACPVLRRFPPAG